MARPRALILRSPGTNCDEETAEAWRIAGAEPEPVHVRRLVEAPSLLDEAEILTIPGGFSYGDDLGAGRILAIRLGRRLRDAILRLRDRGGLVLGVCNGFQVLVKAGLLPGGLDAPPLTITRNLTGRYEDRWVRLAPRAGVSPFFADDEPIDLPVAHGEGRVLSSDPGGIGRIEASGRVALRYVDADGTPAERFPANPNGSSGAIAGLVDETGRILGLMPHPERNVHPLHDPRWTRRGPKPEGDGLRIFRNAVSALA